MYSFHPAFSSCVSQEFSWCIHSLVLTQPPFGRNHVLVLILNQKLMVDNGVYTSIVFGNNDSEWSPNCERDCFKLSSVLLHVGEVLFLV